MDDGLAPATLNWAQSCQSLLPGYEFVEELGRGATGIVYHCRQAASGRDVAIKRLPGHQAKHALWHRFRRERSLLTRLDHPHVVRVFDLLEADGELFLALEYVSGPTLRDLLFELRFAAPNALEILRQLASGLAHAHQRGVVHRDVTPANVLITADGQCKLADFGIAKLIAETQAGWLSSFHTRSGAILGTPGYMSPEAAAGTVRLDKRADVYSLGAVAYELLVGRPPFSPQADPLATLEAHISRPVPRPSLIAPNLSADVEAVLLRALEKQPDRRHQSVNLFWEQLDAAARAAWPGWQRQVDLAGVIGAWRARRAPDIAPDLPTALELAPALRGSGDRARVMVPVFRPRPRRRWVSLLVAVLAGLAAAAIVVVLLHGA